MWVEQTAKLLYSASPILWCFVALSAILIFRNHIAAILRRTSGIEAFGVKLAMPGSQALNAAIELAQKTSDSCLTVPLGDRLNALSRANNERDLVEGAEILWVDDTPSNNRNEARCCEASEQ